MQLAQQGLGHHGGVYTADRRSHGLKDPATGTKVESYTMLTLHANSHPLMKRMHRPDLDPATKLPLPLAQQDKRSVIAIKQGDVDQWLAGTVQEAQELLRLPPVEVFNAGPSSGASSTLL